MKELPIALKEILHRAELRMLCRKLGITDVLLAQIISTKSIPPTKANLSPSTINLYRFMESNIKDDDIINNNISIILIAPGLTYKKWLSLQKGKPPVSCH